MASLRTKITAVTVVGVLGAGGWFLHSVLAAQAQGVLAQAPLNNQVQVPPAFIMALDDSGSMRFQTLFPSRDGGALWDRDGTSGPYSFFHSSGSTSGQLRSSDSTRQFVHVAPYPAPRQSSPGNDNAAIPPIDAFGFSRSHAYNKAYFDPGVAYRPWMNANGSAWADAVPTATRVDPNSSTTTVDLTAMARNTSTSLATHHAFRVRTGMVLPAGMKYSGAPGCGLTNANSSASTPSGWRTLNSAVTATCNVDAHIEFFPATFYLPVSHPAPPGYIEANRVLAQNACTYPTATGLDRCDMYRYEIRPGNYASTAAYDEAITNFANWFSYYGARNRSIVAAITNALVEVNNLRVGHFTINSRTNATMRDMAQLAEKASFYSSIYPLGASGNTPNLQAVEYLGQQFRRTDSGAPVIRSCQKNAGMLFTDGFSNVAGPTVNNVDGGMGVPFQDSHSNTLADIATRFYLDQADGGLAPLRSGAGFAAGQVPVPAACSSLPFDSVERKRLDCQANLHMNFYGVTLGARGETFNPDVERDPFAEPYVAWPAFESNERSTVDDIWHATVNTRGDFINAKTPEDITAAIRKIIQSVSAGSSPSGTLALTGSRISSRSLVVQPSYEVRNEGTDWFSELAAYKVTVNPITREVSETRIWEASEALAAMSYSTRRGHTWYGTNGGAARVSGATLEDLCGNRRPQMSRCTADEITTRLGISAEQAVSYLVGDGSMEVGRPGGVLRSRSSRLGDIINSTPVVSAPTDDYGYRSIGVIGSVNYGATYSTYVDTTKAGRPAMVYVGANDGMLHAFHGGIDAEGDVDAVNGGRELFAYIPRAVMGHTGNLLFPYVAEDGGDQKFDHRYYVDGPIAVSDAYFSGGWKTVLVGTTGAGGRSVFGLDVSDPSAFEAGSRLWEIDDQHADAAVRSNIGHVLGKPVIVPVRTGAAAPEWKAIFGNGYNSESGRAALFVVDVRTGSASVIQAVETGAPGGANGLGNIVVTDQKVSATGLGGRDGFADTVYAADQKGAIWKFDLSSTSALTRPLFTTQTHTESGSTYRQPIIGGLAATAGVGSGVMLFFGTGSFSFIGDAGDASVQSIYAINDRGQTSTMTAANLFQRQIVTSGSGTRTISTGGIVGQNGWYLNLPARERAVGYPRVASGVLFIPTYAPTVADGCSTSGFNWLYGLNTRSGGPALESVRFGSTTGPTQGAGVGAVSLDTGGTAPVKEVGLTVLSRPSPPNPGEPVPPENGCWMRISVAGMTQGMFVPYPCGRQSWRQLQ